MGLAPDTPLRLSGELEAQPDTGFVKAIDEMLAEARREHPALLAAQARLKAAAASVEESRAAGRPSLALSANLARSQSDQAMAFNGDTRERDRSIGLQLNIPLFEGFERTYQVRNALARREASEAELADTEQQVSLEVWNNYQSLSVETRSLARTRELVEQSRQSLEVVQGRYRSGVGSMIELLNALTAYASAEDQHIRALGNWQTRGVELLLDLLVGARQDQAAARAAQGLVGGGGDHVGEGDRVRVEAGGDQPGDVGHVDEQQRADLVGDGAEAREVEGLGVGGEAGDDHLRLMLHGQALDFVVVDQPGSGVQAVLHGVVQLAGGGHLGAVGEMAAVGQAHAEDGVAGVE